MRGSGRFQYRDKRKKKTKTTVLLQMRWQLSISTPCPPCEQWQKGVLWLGNGRGIAGGIPLMISSCGSHRLCIHIFVIPDSDVPLMLLWLSLSPAVVVVPHHSPIIVVVPCNS